MYTQTLQENWKMREAGGDWLEAKVPGTVYTDLLRNGKMEDPYWKDNEDKALLLMEKDYEYETVFSWELLQSRREDLGCSHGAGYHRGYFCK